MSDAAPTTANRTLRRLPNAAYRDCATFQRASTGSVQGILPRLITGPPHRRRAAPLRGAPVERRFRAK
jgi:hypothetical protein